MRRFVPMILFLAFLSGMAGYHMSKPSFIGRVGMDLFYKQYTFLKTWWQGALVLLFVLMFFLVMQWVIQNKLDVHKARIFQGLLILVALAGLYFTYRDFHNTATHKWLKERFHIGAYLFWAGWISISVFYLFRQQPSKDPV